MTTIQRNVLRVAHNGYAGGGALQVSNTPPAGAQYLTVADVKKLVERAVDAAVAAAVRELEQEHAAGADQLETNAHMRTDLAPSLAELLAGHGGDAEPMGEPQSLVDYIRSRPAPAPLHERAGQRGGVAANSDDGDDDAAPLAVPVGLQAHLRARGAR